MNRSLRQLSQNFLLNGIDVPQTVQALVRSFLGFSALMYEDEQDRLQNLSFFVSRPQFRHLMVGLSRAARKHATEQKRRLMPRFMFFAYQHWGRVNSWWQWSQIKVTSLTDYLL